MKLKFLALLCILTASEKAICASSTYKAPDKKESTQTKKADLKFLKQITAEFMYSYVDFSFNSTKLLNFNRYQGHSNLYSAGGDHIVLSETMFAGLYYFNVDTAVNSQFLLAPASLTSSKQTINNNTVFGHVLKVIKAKYYLDLAGAYGQNKIRTNYKNISNDIAVAANSNVNWFVTGNAIYRKMLDKLSIRMNLSALYTETNTPNYIFIIEKTHTTQPVQALLNRVTLIQENIEFGYPINSTISPFVNAGLIQVAGFSNSRALTDQVNGILPQLNMNKDGFRIGAGATINRKNWTLRLEEKYYNAGRTFESYQSIAAFEYRFDTAS